MKKLLLRDVLPSVLIGLLSLWFAPEAHGQQPPPQQGSGQQVKVSDKELRALAKAYVSSTRYASAMSPH